MLRWNNWKPQSRKRGWNASVVTRIPE